MNSSPPERAASKPSLRQDEKQGRESERGGAVGVFGEDGYFVARLHQSRDSEQIQRLLVAPNAEPVRNHGGRLVGIRLLSLGDDRGTRVSDMGDPRSPPSGSEMIKASTLAGTGT